MSVIKISGTFGTGARKLFFLLSFLGALIYFYINPKSLLDTLYIFFLVISSYLLCSEEKYEGLIRKSSTYFIYYFTSRTFFVILVLLGVTRGSEIPGLLSSFKGIFDSPILSFFVFLFFLTFYWQIVARGLVRYGEIIARFYLDALPGQQASIDTEKRDGLLSPESASRERKKILDKSVQLGSLDAGMRLTIGNLFLICLSTIIFFLGRLLLSNLPQSDRWSSMNILEVLSEASLFGFLMLFDGILFLVPLLLAVSHVSTGGNKNLTVIKNFSKPFFLVLVLVLFSLYSLFTRSFIWEPWFLLILLYIYFKTDTTETVSKTSQCVLRSTPGSYEISDNCSFCDQKVPIIKIPERILQNSGKTFHDFIHSIASELRHRNHLKRFHFNFQLTPDSDIKVLLPEGNSVELNIPDSCYAFELPYSMLQVIFPERMMYRPEVLPGVSLVAKNEFDMFFLDNSFMSSSIKDEAWIVSSVIEKVFSDDIPGFVTAEELFEYLKFTSVRKPEQAEYLEVVKEIGYRSILEISRLLHSYGLNGFDIAGIIDALIISDDEELVIKNYVDLAINKYKSSFSASDGLIRTIMVSDYTSEMVSNEYDTNEINISLESKYSIVLERIHEIISTLRMRRQLPLIILIPESAQEWIKDFLIDVKNMSPAVVVLERGLLPKGQQYHPLGSI